MTLSSSVDLPEPDTPLRQTSRWSGRAKERCERLCFVTFVKRSQFVFAGLAGFVGDAAPPPRSGPPRSGDVPSPTEGVRTLRAGDVDVAPRSERGEGAASPGRTETAVTARRRSGVSIDCRPERYVPVMLAGDSSISDTVP